MSLLITINKWIKQDKGTSSVEFAMVGSGFVMLMVGVIELARLAWTSNVVDYAMDEATRYAVLHQDAQSYEVEDYAKEILDSLFVPSSALSITIGQTSSSGVDFIEISGAYEFTSMTSSILPAALSDITLDVASRRPVYLYDEEE